MPRSIEHGISNENGTRSPAIGGALELQDVRFCSLCSFADRPRVRFETADELAALANAYLASFKIPNHWDIRENSPPRNPARKVLKSTLWDGHSGVLGVGEWSDSAL